MIFPEGLISIQPEAFCDSDGFRNVTLTLKKWNEDFTAVTGTVSATAKATFSSAEAGTHSSYALSDIVLSEECNYVSPENVVNVDTTDDNIKLMVLNDIIQVREAISKRYTGSGVTLSTTNGEDILWSEDATISIEGYYMDEEGFTETNTDNSGAAIAGGAIVNVSTEPYYAKVFLPAGDGYREVTEYIPFYISYAASVGDNLYGTFTQALAAANQITDGSAVIKLLSDNLAEEFDEDQEINQTMVLDLNGKTLDLGGHQLDIKNESKLTVTDSTSTDKINGEGIVKSSISTIYTEKGKISVNSGSVYSSERSSIVVQRTSPILERGVESGVLNSYKAGYWICVKDGIFIASAKNRGQGRNVIESTGTVIVTGGRFEEENGSIVPVKLTIKDSNSEISGGNFRQGINLLSYSYSGITIQKLLSDGYSAYEEDGNVRLTDDELSKTSQ